MAVRPVPYRCGKLYSTHRRRRDGRPSQWGTMFNLPTPAPRASYRLAIALVCLALAVALAGAAEPPAERPADPPAKPAAKPAAETDRDGAGADRGGGLPEPYTIRLRDVQPREAFERLFADAGLEPPGGWDGFWITTAPVDVDVDAQPFWLAARALFDQTGVALEPTDRGLKVRRVPRWTWGDKPARAAGPFVIVLESLQRHDTVMLARPGEVRRGMMLQFQVWGDPRVRAVPTSHRLRVDTAVDENGVSLLRERQPDPPPGSGAHGFAGRWHLLADLDCPPAHGQRIAKLAGRLTMVADTGSELWEVPDLLTAANVTRKVAGVQVTLAGVKRQGEGFLVSFRAAREGGDEKQFARFRDTVNGWASRLRVVDADGRPLRRSGGGGSAGPDQVTLDMIFTRPAADPGTEQPGEPAKLVWRVPTGTRELDVPFTFTDLPLPAAR